MSEKIKEECTIIKILVERSRSLFVLNLLARHEQPPDRNEEADAGADTKGTRRTDLVEDRTASKTADKERDNADDLVVARDNAAELKELRVGHELAPDGGKDD